ncbi:hypothetical protein G4B88_019577 [Cannabis sativa]|uniref:GH16 domain-containing protein n=1 Tax=Cannabis sativa TaxID=3483 RepID=A0A7J6HRH0_CANSA|nr:hypothetical protein G4B88_019577 [Cannabis sativa]
MADPALDSETPSLHQTQPLKEIAIDYNPEACAHCADSNSITHLRSAPRISVAHHHSAQIRCPGGNTSDLNFNLYLSSLEGDKSQDEIDFEFLGKDRTIVQTNFYNAGTGNREKIHHLGFDCSDKIPLVRHQLGSRFDRVADRWENYQDGGEERRPRVSS